MPPNFGHLADAPTAIIHDWMFNQAYDAINHVGAGVLNILEGGADPTGVSSSDSAIAAAIAAPEQVIFLPPYRGQAIYKTLVQHNWGTKTVIGHGPKSTILYSPTALGVGVPAHIFSGDRNNSIVRGLGFFGPAPSFNLGVKAGGCDGIRVDGKTLLANCAVQGWDSGIVLNNGNEGGATGHMSLNNCTVNNNYFGIYTLSDGGDTRLFDVDLTGNGMAGIGVIGDAQPSGDGFMDEWFMWGVHFGYGPFGFYQPAGSAVSFVQELVALARFEQIGNAAIYTANPSATFKDNDIQGVGFSWDSGGHTLGTFPKDYPMVLGGILGNNTYRPKLFPLLPGLKGVWNITGSMSGTINTWTAQNDPVTIASGTKLFFVPHYLGLDHAGTATIPSGQSSVVVPSNFWLGDVSGIVPMLTLQGTTPGVTGPSLAFSAISSACVQAPLLAPTATVGGAGGVTAGTHQYYASFATNLGGSNVGHTDTGPGSAVVTAAGGGSTVSVTNIPQGSGDVSAVLLWRSKTGNSGLFLLATLSPGTTTYSDTTADASLGAAVVHSDTSTGTQFTITLSGTGTLTGAATVGWRVR